MVCFRLSGWRPLPKQIFDSFARITNPRGDKTRQTTEQQTQLTVEELSVAAQERAEKAEPHHGTRFCFLPERMPQTLDAMYANPTRPLGDFLGTETFRGRAVRQGSQGGAVATLKDAATTAAVKKRNIEIIRDYERRFGSGGQKKAGTSRPRKRPKVTMAMGKPMQKADGKRAGRKMSRLETVAAFQTGWRR